jgi:dTDP-4-amino-4,6-dideoxygalactose transaminase
MSIISNTDVKIRINNIKDYNKLFEEDFLRNLKTMIQSGQYVLGSVVEEFERKLEKTIGVDYAVGVNSGTSALELAFQVLDLRPEDEVIIQANAYIACAFGALKSNGTLRVIDCDENGIFDINECQKAITVNTKAVLVVHLYGDCCNMEKLSTLCQEHNLKLIEDCAQAQGTKYNGRMIGSYGDMSCFSFYPTKNLGALGDGGAICTSNLLYSDKMKLLRNLGSKIKYEHDIVATNSRLDSLQAAFLLSKFDDMDRCIRHKSELVTQYNLPKWVKHIRNTDDRVYHSYHLYVVQLQGINRDKFMDYMTKCSIETLVHYKIPFYKSKAFASLNNLSFENAENLADTIVSLPVYNVMEAKDIACINEACRKFRFP